MFTHPTIFSFARHIESLAVSIGPQPIFPIQRMVSGPSVLASSPGWPFFCYLSLLKFITQGPLYGFNNPRFGKQNPTYPSISEMAQAYVKEISGFAPSTFSLGGWSFGGFLAFGMAVFF